ncbi:hypothetical protein [Marinimicrobium sp. ABcell2]|uniref:hypothetical protein n=1 Tax=Marinimicrobium sp. ABcell2 TaxID=3069751 RepID=UPI0027B724B1|nr:hypothetical protein [Marinimicrobium sp. ABcell2]MDQ2075250.1 hypothetical protein [Marinimicrobium sp. ABcell2]
MSSLSIAFVIVGLLIVLIGYAFIYQALEKRRKRRQRLIAALKHRQRSFKRMLVSFPSGFLTKELSQVLYQALIDAADQLSHLEPRDRSHKEEVSLYSRELETVRQQETSGTARLDSAEQVADIRRQLQDLHHYIVQQAERGNVSKAQAQVYSSQIKRLVLQMSVDAYTLNARQAREIGKPRLAMHYYNLARKLLVRENAGHTHQQQILQLGEVIAQLEAQLAREPATAEDEVKPTENKEWEQFGETDESWKKKQIYD